MTIKIEAAKRLVTAACTESLKYGSEYKKVWTEIGDAATLKTKGEGSLTVKIMEEDVVDEKHGDKGDSLLTDMPSIEIKAGGKTIELTWNEAFNLADALIHVTSIAYFG